MCVLRAAFIVNFCSQCWHWNVLPSCINWMCVLRAVFIVNFCSQCLQRNILPSCIDWMCVLRWPFCVYFCSQCWHWNVWPSCTDFMCVLRNPFVWTSAHNIDIDMLYLHVWTVFVSWEREDQKFFSNWNLNTSLHPSILYTIGKLFHKAIHA